MIKAFFHGRGPHSRGWDGYVLCGVVPDDKSIFDEKTCDQYPCQNYQVSFDNEPKNLAEIVAEKIVQYQDFIDNPFVLEIERTDTMKRLILEGVVGADSKWKSLDEMVNEYPESAKVALISTMVAVKADPVVDAIVRVK